MSSMAFPMEFGAQKGKISTQLVSKLTIMVIIINLIVLFTVGGQISSVLNEVEADYLSEISENIKVSIEMTLDEFITANKVLAQSDTVIQILSESNKANPMHQNPLADTMVDEMARIANQFGGEILYVGIMDVEQDGYLMHDGDYSDDSYSFKAWDYYTPVVSKTAFITEPYYDDVIHQMVISICYPVIDGSGTVLGITLFDISMSFMEDLILENAFRETGESFVVNSENSILAHKDSSTVTADYSTLKLSGEELTSSLANPSGHLIEFTEDGVKKTGITNNVGDFGWKMVTMMDNAEFKENENTILLTLLVLLTGANTITMVVIAFTVAICLRPLKKVQAAMAELSQGNIHYKLDYEANNEIGELADYLRFTMGNLARYVEEIKRQLAACGDGDFTSTSDMEFLGDFAEIQTSISRFNRLISEALAGIRATVDQVSIGSDYVATGSQTLAEGSTKQSESVAVFKQNLAKNQG